MRVIVKGNKQLQGIPRKFQELKNKIKKNSELSKKST